MNEPASPNEYELFKLYNEQIGYYNALVDRINLLQDEILLINKKLNENSYEVVNDHTNK